MCLLSFIYISKHLGITEIDLSDKIQWPNISILKKLHKFMTKGIAYVKWQKCKSESYVVF